jgi:nitrate/TMAO reductase-like tetraheme cytochrome c subunit
MKRFVVMLVGSLCLFMFAVSVAAENSYVGAAKCKMCHNSKKAGQQFTIWKGTAHAKAYEALASEKAKSIAKSKGIADPQKSDACLKCHAPSYNVKAGLKGPKYNVADGVTCEDCHGPGSAYMKMSTMKAIAAGKEKPEAHGLRLPDEKTCKSCHNEESPTFDKSKPFDFAKMYAKIAHKKPKAE